MKNSRKTNLLLICSILLIGAFLMNGYYQLNPSLSADSGFDVDFDSGSGGGDGGFIDLIYLAIRYPILTLIILIVFIIIVTIENNRKRSADGSNSDAIKDSYVDPTTKELLMNAYQIYYEVQMAWMNFDYEKLKTLVTDELYNSYYNQLQTLELKGQKNVMRDFYVIRSKLLSQKQEEGKTTTVVGLDVSFYDYIIDSNKKVIRGKDTKKVTMFYHLTFVSAEGSMEKCPNCGAPLEKPSYCDYCKSHIQGLSKEMRLSKKEAISQKTER